MSRRGFPDAARHACSVRFESAREDRVVVIEGARELRAPEPRVGQVGAVETRDASGKIQLLRMKLICAIVEIFLDLESAPRILR